MSVTSVLRAFSLVVLSFAAVVPAAAQSRSGTITLRHALERALAANPKLTAADREVGIAGGRSVQAGAIPNPELLAEVENIAGSGAYRGLRSAETTLQLSQLIELGGKRGARMAAGAAEYDSAVWQRQAVRLEVLSETATAYINILAEQRRIDILEQQVTALDRLQPLLRRRVEAGASSEPEVLRAQIAADLVRVEREKARTSLATARRDLAILMGDRSPGFSRAAGDLSDPRNPPAFRVISDAIEGNPQLMRWTAVRAQRDAELLSARLKAIPDVRAGVGWRRFNDTGDNAMTFGLSMSIPLFDQNQGDIAAARESIEKVQADQAINRAALLAVAGKAYDAAAGAVAELSLLRGSVLPNARRTAQAIEDGYAQGRFSLLEVLDVQNAVAEASLREQEALRSFHIAVATIEGLIGRPFAVASGARK